MEKIGMKKVAFITLGCKVNQYETNGMIQQFIKSGYQVRNDRYNGKDCYVLKKGTNEGYGEFWIEKDSMMIIRSIQDLYNNSYTEKNYSITINSVKEEDLMIPELEGYKIEESIENVDEEYIELYKNL